MQLIADLHIHSKYSRACSKDLDISHLDLWARKKGISLLGTGDFTHPKWMQELKEHLRPHENGLLTYTGAPHNGAPVFFVPTAEISCIYTRGGRGRRVHLVLVVPTLEHAQMLQKKLASIGNIASDGRPILGLDSEELTKIVLDISPDALVIPAHAWTPWFAVFGSQSGFDSLEECFGSMTKHIYAIETGLSSDPAMNWRLAGLDHITLISNSDAHSLPNLGREANVFDIAPGSAGQNVYAELTRIIREKDAKKFLYTIEFFPEEGKYHYDGHRVCGVRATPEETKRWNGMCPKCKKGLTVGVLNRVDELADRPLSKKPKNAIPYKSIVPLQEIIAEAFDVRKQSKRVQEEYERLVVRKNEFDLLLNVSFSELVTFTTPEIVEGIRRVRDGNIYIEPGYDGEYGVVRVFKPNERKKNKQQELF